jgi:Domain of unknown function (DUF4365)
MHRNDEKGNLAQDISKMWLHTWCRNGQPIFSVEFLGAKFEGVDFYVELSQLPGIKYFFFVQVKSTGAGLTMRSPQRLKIDVKEKQMHHLLKIPIPTYIIGVDLSTPPGNELNSAYVVYANSIAKTRIRSISTQYSLDKTHVTETLETLWNEVKLFWDIHTMSLIQSAFNDGELT